MREDIALEAQAAGDACIWSHTRLETSFQCLYPGPTIEALTAAA